MSIGHPLGIGMGMPTFQQIGRCPACEGQIVIPVDMCRVILPYVRYVCSCGARFDLCENWAPPWGRGLEDKEEPEKKREWRIPEGSPEGDSAWGGAFL